MDMLLLTNENNKESLEDLWIAKAFQEDGHKVDIRWIDYDKKLDDRYDIILKRNTWISQGISIQKLQEYEKESDKLNERLKNKDKILVNFNGKFDQNGKDYLVDLFRKNYEVIPSIDNLDEFNLLPEAKKYLLKPKAGYDGIGQRKIDKEELVRIEIRDYIVQPLIEFESEVQFYFINRELQYALEFKPSKIPVYPKAIPYKYNEKEIKLAQKFADLNDDFIGIQRIDFIKLYTGELKLLEIEDAAPYLDLDCLEMAERNKFINSYKEMIYSLKY